MVKLRAPMRRPQPMFQEACASWISVTDAILPAMAFPDWAADAALGWASSTWPLPNPVVSRGFPPRYSEASPRVDEEMTDGVDSDSGQSGEMQIALPNPR